MRAEGYSGLFGFARVHSGETRDRRVHSRTRGFTRALSGLWVRLGSRGFTRAALGVVAFILFRVGHLCPPKCRRVDSGSRGFTRAHLEVVGFIRISMGSLCRP